jgi:hypothetical protein
MVRKGHLIFLWVRKGHKKTLKHIRSKGLQQLLDYRVLLCNKFFQTLKFLTRVVEKQTAEHGNNRFRNRYKG